AESRRDRISELASHPRAPPRRTGVAQERARAAPSPRRTRDEGGGADSRTAAERGLFSGGAETESHGQLGLERRQQNGALLVRGNVPHFWMGSAAGYTDQRRFLAASPPRRSRRDVRK